MPIVWKTSFEEPLTKFMQSGVVNNSTELVNKISLLYDLSIKQGLPNAPATVAGPVLIGNSEGFKRILNLYFKLDAAKQKVIAISIYALLIKSYYKNIRLILKSISANSKLLKTLISDQKAINTTIKKLSTDNTITSKRQIQTLLLEKNKLLGRQSEIKNIINTLKSDYKDIVKVKLKSIRDSQRESIQKLLLPKLQSGKLDKIRNIPKVVKTLTTLNNKNIKNIRKIITTNIKQIKELVKSFYSVYSYFLPADVTKLRKLLNTIVSSTNMQTVQKSISIMLFMVIHNKKIPVNVVNIIKNNLFTILKLKTQISDYKLIIKDQLRTEFNKQKKILLDSIKLNYGIKETKYQKLINSRKEIQLIIKQTTKIKKQYSQIKSLKNTLHTEYNTVSKISKNETYIPKKHITESLNTFNPRIASLYNQLSSTKNAILFFKDTNLSVNTVYLLIFDMLILYKDKYIKSIKDKIISRKFNVKQIIFNLFLQQALTVYWVGATTANPVNLGTVLNPGKVILPFSMKSTLNEGDFVKNLSKSLQSHLKTVTGIYISVPPPTGPITAPWVGYS